MSNDTSSASDGDGTEVTESETIVKTDNGERYASLQANNSGEESSDA
jgi:hypothetical protein